MPRVQRPPLLVAGRAEEEPGIRARPLPLDALVCSRDLAQTSPHLDGGKSSSDGDSQLLLRLESRQLLEAARVPAATTRHGKRNGHCLEPADAAGALCDTSPKRSAKGSEESLPVLEASDATFQICA